MFTISLSLCRSLCQQEGQHPLTGQRAANFRLLANHWAERRLVTQWRHGYCVTAAALWGEVCAKQVLPMPVSPFAFRYQGNGATPCQHFDTTRTTIDCTTTFRLRFYIMKLCSRLFVPYCRNCPKDDKFRYFIPSFEEVRGGIEPWLWLVGKPVSSSC